MGEGRTRKELNSVVTHYSCLWELVHMPFLWTLSLTLHMPAMESQ